MCFVCFFPLLWGGGEQKPVEIKTPQTKELEEVLDGLFAGNADTQVEIAEEIIKQVKQTAESN